MSASLTLKGKYPNIQPSGEICILKQVCQWNINVSQRASIIDSLNGSPCICTFILMQILRNFFWGGGVNSKTLKKASVSTTFAHSQWVSVSTTLTNQSLYESRSQQLWEIKSQLVSVSTSLKNQSLVHLVPCFVCIFCEISIFPAECPCVRRENYSLDVSPTNTVYM